jgi:steroid 5-alpha reductase family enzyme
MLEVSAEVSVWSVALQALALIVVMGLATWAVSTWRHDVSLVDRMWPVFIAAAGVSYAVAWPQTTHRADWMLAVGLAWAARLGVYITARNWGHGEDRRYQQIRARNEPGFAFKSLYLVFALQAVLAWIVSWPFLGGVIGTQPLGWLDVIGLAIAAFGLVFEAVGDWQMARFKADPANKGQVMDRGLWGSTRHPNYFGECCVWWGLFIVALAGGSGWWTVVSPLLITVLLLKVSGVTLLEKDMADRRPAYREYVARTNAFFPGWPRRHGGRAGS